MAFSVEITKEEITKSPRNGKKTYKFTFNILADGRELIEVKDCRVHFGRVQPPSRPAGGRGRTAIWLRVVDFSDVLESAIESILLKSSTYLRAVEQGIIEPLGSTGGSTTETPEAA